MNSIRLAIRLAAAAALVSVASLSAFGADLKVGVNPPPLKVLKWVKGKAVPKFEKGKVYVVEFWATWCGPCRQSIPHLTELAAKYKDKVNFTGVSVWEHSASEDLQYVKGVETFVKDMGEKMSYNVAVDDPKGTMAKTWMEAAEQPGIPTAFVIDQEGTVAWIGHPMGGLDEVLDKVLTGKFDARAEAAKKDAAEASMKEMSDGLRDLSKLIKAGKGSEALAKIDEMEKNNPDAKQWLISPRFDALLLTDEKAAYKFADEVGKNEYKADAMNLNYLAWTIVEAKAPVKNPDLDVALRLAERANELTNGKDGFIMDTLAFVHFKKGNVKKAIELQTKALELVKTMSGGADPSIVKEMTDRMEEYKKAEKGA